MRLLLDTHILLWALSDSPKLSPAAKEMILNSQDDVFYSVVSLWETEIKHLFFLPDITNPVLLLFRTAMLSVNPSAGRCPMPFKCDQKIEFNALTEELKNAVFAIIQLYFQANKDTKRTIFRMGF